MQNPARFKVLFAGVAAAVALAAISIFYWSSSTMPPAGEPPGLQAEPSENGPPEESPVTGAEADDPVARPNGRPATSPKSDGSIPERLDRSGSVPPDLALADYKARLWDEIRDDPPVLTDLDDPAVDADLAYRIYSYYGNCAAIPRTETQVDRRLRQIADRAEHFAGRPLDVMEGRVDWIMANYELCYLIPPEVDCRREAVRWMTRAVQLGHDVAEIQFYDRAMGFLLRPDQFNNDPALAMLEPGLVFEFKDTARAGLARALEKGHPEAFLANAQALLEGLIYPKNPTEAFAYAQAAERLAARHHLILEDLDDWKTAAAQQLTDEERADAEEMALELQSAPRD